MDTMIAATDYSPLAENAAAYAAALAKMAGERLVLLNDFVVTPHAENARIPEYQPRVLVLGMAPRSWEQKRWGNTTTEVIKKLHTAVLVVPGGPYRGFRKVLWKYWGPMMIRSGADLLIMAPQKHGFWDSFVHRSKTRIMASGLEIPLLALPL